MMTEAQVYEVMQPYLDGELDATRRAEVEQYLAQHPEVAEVFASEKQFHTLVKKSSIRIEMPEGFQDKLRKSLDAQASAGSPNVLRPHVSWTTRYRPMLAIAAMLMLAVAIGAYVNRKSLVECPYMTGCANVHSKTLAQLEVNNTDMETVRKWAQGKSGLKIGVLPDFKTYGLQIKGAGAAVFDNLKKYNAPDGVYVQYASAEPQKDPVTLIVHPWPEEKPMMMNYDEKTNAWLAVHQGMSVVAWKRSCDQAVLSLVSKRPMDEMIKMTAEVRGEMEMQEPPKPVTLLYFNKHDENFASVRTISF